MEKPTIEQWQQRHQALIQLWRDYETAIEALHVADTAVNGAIDESQALLEESGRHKRPVTPDPGYTMAALAFEARGDRAEKGENDNGD